LKTQIKEIKNIRNKLQFFKGHNGGGFDLNLNDPDFTEQQLIEIHATRHILVHNMGVVDKKYIADVSDTALPEDEERPLPDEYITASFKALNNFVMFLKQRIEEKFCGIAD
jgi:hypothetical protein